MIYVIYVKPQSETEVCTKLNNMNISAYAPTRTILERHKGRWKQVVRVIYPSYVFIDTDLTVEIYYTVKKTDGVLRFLGSPPEAIKQSEANHLKWIFEMQNIDISKGILENGRLMITDGTLVGQEHLITDYNPRIMRGWIHTQINGEDHSFSVTIDTR
ncbi:MAG: transcription termination/antitermination NusG family protein [Ruminococcus sp.]|nr:transcription termination/antitermination NusG family protein [Ruminococcus sp.]